MLFSNQLQGLLDSFLCNVLSNMGSEKKMAPGEMTSSMITPKLFHNTADKAIAIKSKTAFGGCMI